MGDPHLVTDAFTAFDRRATASTTAPAGDEPPTSSRIDEPWQGRAALRVQRKRAARRELALLVVVTLGLTLLARALVLQAFFIPSPSMENTLLVGDRVLVNKLLYDIRDIRRGEIVVFDGTDSFLTGGGAADGAAGASRGAGPFQRLLEFFGAATSKHDYIKRVIGLPGDRIACCDANGRLTVNGRPLTEPYVHAGDVPSRQRFDVVVPRGRLWVMGDHRSRSADSRAHLGQPGGGTVPVDKVVGRAFLRVWPLTRIGSLPVPNTFDEVAATQGDGRGTGG
jgi:signal peptidase I